MERAAWAYAADVRSLEVHELLLHADLREDQRRSAPSTFCREFRPRKLGAGRSAPGSARTESSRARAATRRFGDVWLRYEGSLRNAERWARARLGQTVRVYPNIEEAQKMRIYLIRSRQIDLEKRLKRQRGYGREFESLA